MATHGIAIAGLAQVSGPGTQAAAALADVRSGRVAFLDLARGLAIVFMTLVHALVVYAPIEDHVSVVGLIVGFLGGAPAAPVFMFLMGVFLGSPKRVDLAYGVSRGIRLLALAYFLNLVRLSLPLWVLTGSLTVQVESFSAWSALWMVDILHLAGLSFILLTVVRRFLPWRAAWLGLGLLIAFVSPVLWGCLDFPGSSLLWGTGQEVVFPLFPWVVFPLLGMVCAPYLHVPSGVGRLSKRFSRVGVLLIVLGFVLDEILGDGQLRPGDYARMDPWFLCVVVGIALIWLRVCDWLTRRVPANRVYELLFCWSRNVTAMYVLQWILICWGVFLFGYQQHTALQAAEIGLVVLFLSHALIRLHVWYRCPFQSRALTDSASPAVSP